MEHIFMKNQTTDVNGFIWSSAGSAISGEIFSSWVAGGSSKMQSGLNRQCQKTKDLKMTFFFQALFGLGISLIVLVSGDPCPPGFQEIMGKCYFYSEEETDQNQAIASCK